MERSTGRRRRSAGLFERELILVEDPRNHAVDAEGAREDRKRGLWQFWM